MSSLAIPPAGFERAWYLRVEAVEEIIVGVVVFVYGEVVGRGRPCPRPRDLGGDCIATFDCVSLGYAGVVSVAVLLIVGRSSLMMVSNLVRSSSGDVTYFCDIVQKTCDGGDFAAIGKVCENTLAEG